MKQTSMKRTLVKYCKVLGWNASTKSKLILEITFLLTSNPLLVILVKRISAVNFELIVNILNVVGAHGA